MAELSIKGGLLVKNTPPRNGQKPFQTSYCQVVNIYQVIIANNTTLQIWVKDAKEERIEIMFDSLNFVQMGFEFLKKRCQNITEVKKNFFRGNSFYLNESEKEKVSTGSCPLR
jgi:hypothetical protein